MKKRYSKRKNSENDDNTLMSSRSMENLKTKEKEELLKFLNEHLNQPLVFYSTYYQKHGKNILQRNYKKKNIKKIKDDDDDDDEYDENDEYIDTQNLLNNSMDKNSEANVPGKDGDKVKKDTLLIPTTYSKRFDEETCYFDMKNRAHAIPMKWYESNKVYNDYQQIPRTTKVIDLNSENDRNTNFSLFNRQLLNKNKWEKMDRYTQAKYYIYENPLPEIQNFVINTAKRNQIYERNIRDQIQYVYGNEKTTSELNHMIEKQRQKSLEASQKASQRLKEQFLWQLDTRNSDLQHLLEGQPTALDAIRLKEFLLLKPLPVRTQLNISEKDRRRLGHLLSNRGS